MVNNIEDQFKERIERLLAEKRAGRLTDTTEIEEVIQELVKAGGVGRAFELVKVGISDERAIQVYEDARWFAPAGLEAEKAGMLERAITNYERGKNFLNAATAAIKAGDNSRAIGFYEQAEQYYKAADLAVQIGDINRAIDNYGRARVSHKRIIDLAVSNNMFDKAIELMTKWGDFVGAANIIKQRADRQLEDIANEARKAGKLEEAVSVYVKLGRFKEAGDLIVNQDRVTAISLYKRAGEFETVEKLLTELNVGEEGIKALYREAMHAYETSDKFDKAADYAKKLGDFRTASQLYQREGKLREAAQMAIKAGDLEKAADLYFENGSFSKAAELKVKLGQQETAVELYIKGRSYDKAAKLVLSQGDVRRGISIYEAAGWFEQAAQLAKDNNLTDLADVLTRRASEQAEKEKRELRTDKRQIPFSKDLGLSGDFHGSADNAVRVYER